MKFLLQAMIVFLLLVGSAAAKVDLVTLPARDTVQLTLYSAADLTLVRESRTLSLQEGINRLQFSWTDTRVDPTSLDLVPRQHARRIDVRHLAFPPGVHGLGVWTLHSETADSVPVEITYLVSGLAWHPFYMATLAADEGHLGLQSFVRVTNASGEDFEDAEIRLVAGRLNLLDDIAALARRHPPYDKPAADIGADRQPLARKARLAFEEAAQMAAAAPPRKPPEISAAGRSEYFLYTISGRHDLAAGWSRRLQAFAAARVPVVNRYRFEAERFGDQVVRLVTFKNETASGLGKTPLAEGALKLFREANAEGHLAYVGAARLAYTPVAGEVELNLGPANAVRVEPVRMKYETTDYRFFENGDISGWDQRETYRVKVHNSRPLPVRVEVLRNFATPNWKLEKKGDYGRYEVVDADSVKFTLEMAAQSRREFDYVVTTHHGRRGERAGSEADRPRVEKGATP